MKIGTLFMSTLLFITGCGQAPELFNLTDSTNGGTANSGTCSTTVVDYGVKGLTLSNTGRGLFSDTKLNPTNKYPAYAYNDASTVGGTMTIRLTYWNGTRYLTEIVAGDAASGTAGSARMIRLNFLSDGTPLIFWTTNTTVGVVMAARSAPLTSDSAATWTRSVIDSTATASGAIEVSVNPLDQVGIVYLTNTAAAGRARFVYCASSCAIPGNYVTMNLTTDTIEASNVIANTTSVGMAWCKNSSTQYYPAVTFGGNASAAIRYGVCLNTLSGCRTAAGWSLISAVASATTVTSKLHIDSASVGANPLILSRTTAGTLLQAVQVNQPCNTTPVGVTTNANTLTGSAATTGSLWADLLVDATGKYHVLVNEGTTSVRYYNSVTNAFSTTTWNAVGTLDGVSTLPAALAGVGGADIDTTNGMLYTSYGQNAAPFNLAVATVTDYTVASSSVTASIHYPDMTGGIQSNIFGSQNSRNVSMAVTSTDRPAVAYVDYSAGLASNNGGLLKYAYRTTASSSGSWVVGTIPGATNPHFPSIAFDQNDKPWIGYYDDATTKRFYLVTNSRTDGTGTWSVYMAPFTTKTTKAVSPAADDVSVAMYYSGGVAYPVLIFSNSHATGTAGVRSTKLNPNTGSWTPIATVDSMGGGFTERISSDFDRNGNIVFAQYDVTNTFVRYNHSANGGVSWGTATTASSAATGQGVNIKLNPSTGVPAISYYSRATGGVYYNACTGTTPAACLTAARWLSPQLIENAGVSGIVAANWGLVSTGLTFSSTGIPSLVYPRGVLATSPGLALASQGTSTLDTVSVLYAATNAGHSQGAVTNFGLAGFNIAASRDSAGYLKSSYVGPGNWLYVTSCGD